MTRHRLYCICLLFICTLTGFKAVATEGLIDPTRPSGYSSGDNFYLDELRKEYILNSVIISDQRRVAVISGKRVSEGDRVKNALVDRIGKSRVTLVVDGARVDIHLSNKNFKHY